MMRRFAALVLCLVFCCTMIPAALADEPSGVEDGVLTVAMECNYAPYNWSQGDDSNGAVPIRDSREYANGYDVMMAKKLCEANGWQLEIVRLDWDSLVPAVQAGVVDAGGKGFLVILQGMLDELNGDSNYCAEHMESCKTLTVQPVITNGTDTTYCDEVTVFIIELDNKYYVCA